MRNFLKAGKVSLKKVSKNPLTLTVLGILLASLTIFTFYNLYYSERIYPGISIGGTQVGGLKIEDAAKKLERESAPPEKISLLSEGDNFEISVSEIDVEYDYLASSEAAYNLDRTGNILFDFGSRTEAFFRERNIGARLRLNEEALQKHISVIDGATSQDPVLPSVKIINKEVVVDKGSKGLNLDVKLLRAQIGENLSYFRNDPIILPTKAVDLTLTDGEANALRERADKVYQKSIALRFEFQTFTISGSDLLSFLNPKGSLDNENVIKKIENISITINREPQDSKFVFENSKAKEFAPSKDGIAVDSQSLRDEIANALKKLEETEENQIALEIPVEKTEAKIKTEEVNNLGIKELIGRGTSRFAGSIPSRVHNVVLASSRLNGTIVPPGETLSFNAAVGDVSALTGYQQAYVIKDGKTVLGDGGGLCQVSTTLFRAALNTGLPITERRAHSYRVGYYEQDGGPGLDATVYSPTTDFKFKNDTPGHILIQTIADPKNYTLAFEIYGTSDGRSATVTKPVVSQVVKPADDLYQDDPTIPAGVVRQVEHRANGAKVSFVYSVTRGGQNIYEKNFVSNYRPWQAVYLRGTGLVQ